MKKTVEEHNNQILEDYIKQISAYKWLTISEAGRLNAQYLVDNNPEIKEKILKGIQHIIINSIMLMDLNLGDQTIVDMDDVISYFNLYFVRCIENGVFINATTISEIIDKEFMINFYTYLGTGKNFYTPLQQAKDEVDEKDPYKDIETRMFINELLDMLEENEILITHDIYEKKYFGDKAVLNGKRRRSDIFMTNRLTGGELFDELRNDPCFEELRQEASEIIQGSTPTYRKSK